MLIEMLTGTVRPAVAAAGPATVEACTALLGALADRTVRDLQQAVAPVERPRTQKRRP